MGTWYRRQACRPRRPTKPSTGPPLRSLWVPGTDDRSAPRVDPRIPQSLLLYVVSASIVHFLLVPRNLPPRRIKIQNIASKWEKILLNSKQVNNGTASNWDLILSLIYNTTYSEPTSTVPVSVPDVIQYGTYMVHAFTFRSTVP
jgi:hypothetical protein